MRIHVRACGLVLAVLVAAACWGQCPGGVCLPPSGWQSAPPSQSAPSPPVGRVVQLPSDIVAAICRVRNDVGGQASLGSGSLVAIVGQSGYVLTCDHLFRERVGQVSVQFPSGPPVTAGVIARDSSNDLALLKTASPNARPLRVDPTPDAAPLTAAGLGGDGTLRAVTGPVAGRSTPQGARFPSLLIGGAVRSGDSGGPVLSPRGGLVGVVWGVRGGVTYVTVGEPVRQILSRIPPPSDGMIALKPPTDVPASVPAKTPACDCPCQGDCVRRSELESFARRSELAAVQNEVNQLASQGSVSLSPPSAESKFSLTTVLLVLGALGIGGPVSLAWLVALLARRAATLASSPHQESTTQPRGPGGPRPPDFPQPEPTKPTLPVGSAAPPTDPR